MEVHDEAELERALAAGATLVGVNQRDLATFAVDPERAERVAAQHPRRRGGGGRVGDHRTPTTRAGWPTPGSTPCWWARAGAGRRPGGRGGRAAGYPVGRRAAGRTGARAGERPDVEPRTAPARSSSRSAASPPRPTLCWPWAWGPTPWASSSPPRPARSRRAPVADIVKRLPLGVLDRRGVPRRGAPAGGRDRQPDRPGRGPAARPRDGRGQPLGPPAGARHHQGLPGRRPHHRALRRVRGRLPADRRAQPGVGRGVRLAAGRGGGRPDAADRLGRPDPGQRGPGHRPPAPLRGGRGQRGGGRAGPQGPPCPAGLHQRRPPAARELAASDDAERPRPEPGAAFGPDETPTTGWRPEHGRQPTAADCRRGGPRGGPMRAHGPARSDGRFGEFGGRFVPESLVPACLELAEAFDEAWADPAFRASWTASSPTTAAGPRRSPSATGCPSASGSGCCSSARTWPTPARTRSTTCWARRC